MNTVSILIITIGVVLCVALLVAPTMYQQIVKHQDVQKEVSKIKEDFKELSECYSNDVTNFSNKVKENADLVNSLVNDIMKDYDHYVKSLDALTTKLYYMYLKPNEDGKKE